MNPKIFSLFLSLLVILISCKKDLDTPEKVSGTKYLTSLDFYQNVKLIQTNDSLGEWGGNTFVITIYRDFEGRTLADYQEFEGTMEPPPPPKRTTKSDSIKMWYEFKTLLKEKKEIELSPNEIILVEKAIAELVYNKLSNSDLPLNPGMANEVVLSDSTLIINDSPSIKWSNFRKLQEIIK